MLLLIITSCKKENIPNLSHPPSTPPAEKKWVVSTFSGNGSRSIVNGPLFKATYHFPFDITITNNGNMLIADFGNSAIRSIIGNNVSTLAGTTEGFLNGPVATAQFKEPFSITSDANGNIYVSDEQDPRIRKISPDGIVSTYAGSADAGFADGRADIAQFQPGSAIASDPQGNVYVADVLNNRIRKITVSGDVITIAGDGTAGFKDGNGTTTKFNYPASIAIDSQGNLYVTDAFNFRVRKITPNGDVSTLAGNGQDGTVDGSTTNSEFSDNLNDLITDTIGNVYVEDGPLIRKISSQGNVTTIAGSVIGFKDGDGLSAKFNLPIGIAIDTNGNLYVADVNNNRIRKISFQ